MYTHFQTPSVSTEAERETASNDKGVNYLFFSWVYPHIRTHFGKKKIVVQYAVSQTAFCSSQAYSNCMPSSVPCSCHNMINGDNGIRWLTKFRQWSAPLPLMWAYVSWCELDCIRHWILVTSEGDYLKFSWMYWTAFYSFLTIDQFSYL